MFASSVMTQALPRGPQIVSIKESKTGLLPPGLCQPGAILRQWKDHSNCPESLVLKGQQRPSHSSRHPLPTPHPTNPPQNG